MPIAKSEVYLKGYSLESLRDLELKNLATGARDGYYFDKTLRRLFTLVAQGCGLPDQANIHAVAGAKDTAQRSTRTAPMFQLGHGAHN